MERDGGSKYTEFITPNQLAADTGLPRGQIMKDIHSGKLPAMKRGKSYYIYRTDSSKYIYNLVCEARGHKPGDFDFLIGVDMQNILEAIKKKAEVNNDKLKN